MYIYCNPASRLPYINKPIVYHDYVHVQKGYAVKIVMTSLDKVLLLLIGTLACNADDIDAVVS